GLEWTRLALVTMPDCRAWRKILVSRTAGSDPAASRSRSTSPAPTEGSWSTSPTSSRCAPGGTALTSLLARMTSTMEVSSTTTRSASSGWSASKDGSPPGRSCSSRWMVAASWRASSASRLAGQPVGPGGVQAQEGGGQGPFGLIKGRQVDGGNLRCGLSLRRRARGGHLLADHSLGGGQLVQARGDQVGGHVEDLGGAGDQVGG